MLARKNIKLQAVQANVGLEKLLKKRLMCLVDAMHNSIEYWVLAAYKAHPPRMIDLAQDAAPADELQQVVNELKKRWTKRFDEGAEALGDYFAKAAYKRTDAQLKAILKKAGISVDFKMTKAQRDVVGAIVNENVSLIKSIPEQYLKGVEGAVMRSVQTGMDVGGLSKSLQKQYGVTKRRAQTISRDQNSKANSSLNRVRQLELGVEKAIWHHSHAGKKPRKSHLANNGQEYDVRKGWFDPDEREWIQPGQLINCRCTSEPIIPGFK